MLETLKETAATLRVPLLLSLNRPVGFCEAWKDAAGTGITDPSKTACGHDFLLKLSKSEAPHHDFLGPADPPNSIPVWSP